jgi:hypothetical protein
LTFINHAYTVYINSITKTCIVNDIPIPIPERSQRFIHRNRAFILARGLTYKTERTYFHWVLRFIRFHQRRHPTEMGERKDAEFLTHLVVTRHISPATQNQALNAILLTRFGDNPLECQKFLQYLCSRCLYIRIITYIFKFHGSNNPYPLR